MSGLNFSDEPVEDNTTSYEVLSNIPVCTLKTPDENVLRQIIGIYGENAVYRIINASFLSDALEYGTDKAGIDICDLRRMSNGAGYDIWSVEEKALERGLRRSDSFCALPYFLFSKELSDFDTTPLGIPTDRSAILIYDTDYIEEVGDTDGYFFTDPENRKDALRGAIRFIPKFQQFEIELLLCANVSDKVKILESEVYQNINSEQDVRERGIYISMQIIDLLKESILNPSLESHIHETQLRSIAERLSYETRMLELAENLENHLALTHKAFASNDEKRMNLFYTWPNFVLDEANEYLKDHQLDEKYRSRFQRIIQDANACKTEFGL